MITECHHPTNLNRLLLFYLLCFHCFLVFPSTLLVHFVLLWVLYGEFFFAGTNPVASFLLQQFFLLILKRKKPIPIHLVVSGQIPRIMFIIFSFLFISALVFFFVFLYPLLLLHFIKPACGLITLFIFFFISISPCVWERWLFWWLAAGTFSWLHFWVVVVILKKAKFQ